jgi:DNA-binding IclR family transcriptional regulator
VVLEVVLAVEAERYEIPEAARSAIEETRGRGRVVAVLTALGATGGFDPGLNGPIAPLVLREAAAISLSLGAVPAG